ncbi:MAG: hypothetical protein Q9N26_04200, partial [Aquificota bacterium]|nr:hypothetical protein [Aquificota bacterium]
MKSGDLFRNGKTEALSGPLLTAFAVSWSVSDTFILLTYLLLLLFLITRLVSLKLHPLRDPALLFPISLSLWRLLTSFLGKNMNPKVLWKASKFVFDISPVFVFRPFADMSRQILFTFPVAVGVMTFLALGVRYLGLPLDLYDGIQLKAFFVNHIKSGFVWSLASLVALIIGVKHDRRFLFLFP